MKPPRRGVDFEGTAEPAPPARPSPQLWDDVPEAPGLPAGRAGGGRAAPQSPLDPDALFRAATFYLARYSASTARLREVLERKARRRCALGGAPAPEPAALRDLLDGVVARLTGAGLLDDASYGHGRAAALARKGWPAWRIRAELRQQGVDLEAGDEALPPDEDAQAARLARRKRLGPYRPGARAAHRDRDIRALARAGFPVEVARRAVDGDAED